jgi:hypothetical protein
MRPDDFDERAQPNTTFELIGLVALCLLVVLLFGMLMAD